MHRDIQRPWSPQHDLYRTLAPNWARRQVDFQSKGLTCMGLNGTVTIRGLRKHPCLPGTDVPSERPLLYLLPYHLWSTLGGPCLARGGTWRAAPLSKRAALPRPWHLRSAVCCWVPRGRRCKSVTTWCHHPPHSSAQSRFQNAVRNHPPLKGSKAVTGNEILFVGGERSSIIGNTEKSLFCWFYFSEFSWRRRNRYVDINNSLNGKILKI